MEKLKQNFIIFINKLNMNFEGQDKLAEEIYRLGSLSTFIDMVKKRGYTIQGVTLSNYITKRFYRLSNNYALMKYRNDMFIIDINFKDTFIIARPTKEYADICEKLPHVFVGTRQELFACVSFLCAKMKESFKQSDLHIPPWRNVNSILSKWRLFD
jgi:uncharacterized protein (TIGR01615 family)